MSLPTEITFSIEKDLYRPAIGKDGEEGYKPAETYGPECAGTIVMRWPTQHELAFKIPGMVSAIILDQIGEHDPSNVPGTAYAWAHMMVLLSVLGTTKPPWLWDQAPFNAKIHAGVLHARQRAVELFAGKDGSSASDGEKSSSGS